jgi:hypothetical protein
MIADVFLAVVLEVGSFQGTQVRDGTGNHQATSIR